MYEEYSRKKVLGLVGAVLSVVAIIIIVSLIFIIPRLGKIEVYVGFAPFVSEVRLDDEIIKNNEKHYLEKGEHVVSATLDGFEMINKTVLVDEETEAIFGSMVAITEEGMKIANEHVDDFNVIESYASSELQKQGMKDERNWPIITKLPISNSLYKVGYIIDGDDISLTVSSSNSYMNTAVSKLKNAALKAKDNLTKYRIVFKEYENVLKDRFVANNEASAGQAIRSGFSGVDSFAFIKGEEKGDYYIAKVSTGSDQTYSLVNYVLVMKKQQDGSWSLLSTPEPIATVYNVPNVPAEILDSANSL